MKGCSAGVQPPGNSNAFAQSALMWPWALTQVMMMLFQLAELASTSASSLESAQ